MRKWGMCAIVSLDSWLIDPLNFVSDFEPCGRSVMSEELGVASEWELHKAAIDRYREREDLERRISPKARAGEPIWEY